MTVLSKSALIATINAKVTTNGNNENTGLRVREVLTDIVDSTFNAIDDSAISGNWIPVDVLFGEFAAEASFQKSIKIYDLPAGGQFNGTALRIDVGDEFTGGVIASMLIEVGVPTAEDAQGSINGFNPTADKRTILSESKVMYDWDNPTEVFARFTSTGAFLNQLTNGKFQIKLNVTQPK